MVPERRSSSRFAAEPPGPSPLQQQQELGVVLYPELQQRVAGARQMSHALRGAGLCVVRCAEEQQQQMLLGSK